MQGTQGSTGATGLQGTQGATGSQGATGPAGTGGDSYWIISPTDPYNLTNIPPTTGADISGNLNVSGNMNVQDSLYVNYTIPTINISGTYTNTGVTTNPPGTYTYWWYNTLTSSPPNWTFDVSTNVPLTFNYVAVGGGGGGSTDAGGGGGGISTGTFIANGNSTYDINVGLGGNGGGTNASPGTSSTISINGNTFANAYGGGGAYYNSLISESTGGLGGIGTTQNGAYGGSNVSSGPPNNAEPVSPINTFYLDTYYNGYYTPTNAFYSGGGGAYGGQGSQTLSNNPGPGGGPGGNDGPSGGSAGWWGAGGAANGSVGPSFNGGYNGIVIIWIETANLNNIDSIITMDATYTLINSPITSINSPITIINGQLNLTSPTSLNYTTSSNYNDLLNQLGGLFYNGNGTDMSYINCTSSYSQGSSGCALTFNSSGTGGPAGTTNVQLPYGSYILTLNATMPNNVTGVGAAIWIDTSSNYYNSIAVSDWNLGNPLITIGGGILSYNYQGSSLTTFLQINSTSLNTYVYYEFTANQVPFYIQYNVMRVG